MIDQQPGSTEHERTSEEKRTPVTSMKGHTISSAVVFNLWWQAFLKGLQIGIGKLLSYAC